MARELEAAGWEILGTNLRAGAGEIDILARRRGILHVVEVRSRTGTSGWDPAGSVGPRKRARIAAVVAALSGQGRLPAHRELRFDIATVVRHAPNAMPRVELIENAFDAVDLM
ncbi:MAG: YraN family protein [Myxococcota bacterium]|nr:YraN family protein [Myxococcota bacterium]